MRLSDITQDVSKYQKESPYSRDSTRQNKIAGSGIQYDIKGGSISVGDIVRQQTIAQNYKESKRQQYIAKDSTIYHKIAKISCDSKR